MFSASERVLYGKRQLIEAICQLRFPTILSISAKEPAEFQEAIRAEFPRYARNLEKLPPKVIGQPGAMKLEEQPTVVNYQFLTAAGDWKVNLTNTFLALATPVYTTWEDFARKLDEVLAQFKADLLVLDIAALDHTGAAVQLQAAAARQRHLHILRDALDALLLHVVLRHQAKIGGLVLEKSRNLVS